MYELDNIWMLYNVMLLRYKASEATSKLKMMRRGRFRKATRLNASSFKRPSSSFRWKKNRRYVCLCFSALSRSAKTSHFLIDIVLIEVDFFYVFIVCYSVMRCKTSCLSWYCLHWHTAYCSVKIWSLKQKKNGRLACKGKLINTRTLCRNCNSNFGCKWESSYACNIIIYSTMLEDSLLLNKICSNLAFSNSIL